MHARGLALEVGRHLWENVYERDEDYVTSRDPTKERSLNDIALATGYTADELRHRVIAALTREKLERMGLELPRYDVSDFAVLYGLRRHPGAAAHLARWGHDNDVDVRHLKVLVRHWRRTLDADGSIQALIDDPMPPEMKKKKEEEGEKRKRRKRRTVRSGDELRVLRILELVRRWVREVRFSPAEKAHIRRRLLELRAALTGRR